MRPKLLVYTALSFERTQAVNDGVLALGDQSLILMCPHTTTYVSSYYYICVMCPHTAIYVSSVNDGVLAWGDDSVRIYSRGCVPLATISVPEDAQGLMCMDLVPQTASLVCGGRLPHLTGSDVC